MVELKNVHHTRNSRKKNYPTIEKTEFTFDLPNSGSYHIAVKNGKLSEHPEQRPLDTIPEETANVVAHTALLAHAHLNQRFSYNAGYVL